MDAAIAPSVIIFNVYPIAYKTISVAPSVTGIMSKIVALALKERRKIMATIMANKSPTHRLSVTLFTEVFTKSACT